MKHLEKPLREVFTDICDCKLTNLEVDAFIKLTTDKFKLPKLKRLIVDYEHYIQRERPDLLDYFKYLYGEREKFKQNGKIDDVDAADKIIKDREKKYKGKPEFTHSEFDSTSSEIEQFSPFMSTYSSAAVLGLPGLTSFHNDIIKLIDKYHSSGSKKMLWRLFPVLMSTSTLKTVNQTALANAINTTTNRVLAEKNSGMEGNQDFMKGLEDFLDSQAYHFNVKLHMLYTQLLKYGNKSNIVSEPSTPYNTEKPTREHSPAACAKVFLTKSGAGRYSEEEIAFVMEYADQHEHIDNVKALIDMVKKDPNCPKRIKEKKDKKAERNWIKHFDKMNHIDRKK